MRENLESFFTLEYPTYEIIFSVAETTDPAAVLVDDLIHRHPHVDAKLLVGATAVGPNPKVNNLVKSYQTAKYDTTLISDSNVRVPQHYLKRLAGELDSGTGVVTAVIVGHAPLGIGGLLEATFLNTFYARWMMLSARLGWPTVVGKSMFFRRSTMDRFGGIQNMGRYLAEDYMTGTAMQHLGLRVKIMRDAVPQIIGKHSFKDFWDRHVRWGRMRKSQAPLALFFEPLCGPVLSGAMGAWGFKGLMDIAPLHFLGAHLLSWFACDVLIMLSMGARVSPLTPFVWITREFLAIPHWVHILSGNTVKWRGNRLRLYPGGILAESHGGIK